MRQLLEAGPELGEEFARWQQVEWPVQLERAVRVRYQARRRQLRRRVRIASFVGLFSSIGLGAVSAAIPTQGLPKPILLVFLVVAVPTGLAAVLFRRAARIVSHEDPTVDELEAWVVTDALVEALPCGVLLQRGVMEGVDGLLVWLARRTNAAEREFLWGFAEDFDGSIAELFALGETLLPAPTMG